MGDTMKQLVAILLVLQAFSNTSYGKGRIQNEDIKSLSDLTTSVLTTTGTLTSGNACMTSVGSTSGLAAGQFIYDTTTSTNIASGVTIAGLPGSCSAGQIQMSSNAAGSGTGDTVTFGGQASQLINDSKIWMTSVTPNQQLSSAVSTGAIGGGGGGSKNYLSTYTASTSSGTPNTGNGNFEQGSTNGFSLGTTGTLTNGLPTGSPTFGSGASGNLSLAVVSSAQLQGNYSLSYVSSAATTAGNMVASSAFFIDSQDQGKVLTYKMSYKAQSGAANDNFSGTSSNSFAVAAYDVTNSAWLPVVGSFNFIQGSGTGLATGTFQTSTTTAQIRFVFYNASATAGATTLYLDDLSVGPQVSPVGPAVTDWVAYTPTFVGFGTVTNINFYSKRVGDTLQVRGTFQAGTTTATTAQITMGFNGSNANVITDSSKANNSVVGAGSSGTTSTTNFGNLAVLLQTGQNYISLGIQSSTANGFSTANGNAVAGTGAFVEIFYEAPIVGWSANTSMSSDTDTRVVAMSANNTASSITSSMGNVIFSSTLNDTSGSYNTANGIYTVPVTGYYSVSSAILVNSGSPANGNIAQIQIITGGPTIKGLVSRRFSTSASNLTVDITRVMSLNAGDTIQIQASTDASTPTLVGGANSNYFQVNRLSGPAVVAATESVNASYNTSTTSVTSSNVPIVLTNKIRDTHNAYSTSTGLYTAPVSGAYWVTGTFVTNNSTSRSIAFIYKNGVETLRGNDITPTTTAVQVLVAGLVVLNAGDTVGVYGFSGTTSTVQSGPTNTGFSIARVGN